MHPEPPRCGRFTRCALALILATGACAGLAPAAASAATLTYGSGTYTYSSAPGESPFVTVESANMLQVKFTIGSGAVFTGALPPSGCTYTPDKLIATCNQAAPLIKVVVNGNDGSDTFLANGVTSQLPIHFNGGAGTDQLQGGAGGDIAFGGIGNDALLGFGGQDQLHGGDGNDGLDGGEGNDQVFGEDGDEYDQGGPYFRGGPGNDTIDGGPGDDRWDAIQDGGGKDTFVGGPGFDSVSGFNAWTGGLTWSLNGVADDTVAGAPAADSPDNVGGADVEKLIGSYNFADALVGNDIPNVLDDGAIGNNVDSADDTLNGLGGNDLLLAHGGGDTLNGDAGFDTLMGGPGDDALNGGAENDLLQGEAGGDAYNGGDGIDTADFSDRQSITVSFDGAANDGDAGDADNVGLDTENITGSPYADVISGSPAANSIVAGAGADTIDVRGDAAIDQADCGVGFDSVVADAADLLLGDAAGRCENVDQPGTTGNVIAGTGSGEPTANTGTTAGGGTGTTPPPADTKAPAVVIDGLKRSYTAKVFRKGIAPKLGSDEDVQFRVTLRAKATRPTIAADLLLAEKAMPFGTGMRVLPIKPDRGAIGTRKRFTVTLRVEAIDRAGNSAVAVKTLRVK
jgi:Ca2+-binding RTX toxin-like protein